MLIAHPLAVQSLFGGHLPSSLDDNNGNARSRRRASARRGEAPPAYIIMSFVISHYAECQCTKNGEEASKNTAIAVAVRYLKYMH